LESWNGERVDKYLVKYILLAHDIFWRNFWILALKNMALDHKISRHKLWS
jgi:hypothetical protein